MVPRTALPVNPARPPAEPPSGGAGYPGTPAGARMPSRRRRSKPGSADVPSDGTSLLAWIRDQLDPVTGMLPPDGDELPDGDRFWAGEEIRWAPGALDGVATHHVGSEEHPELEARLVEAVVDASRRGNAKSYQRLYAHANTRDLLSVVDGVLGAIPDAGADPRGTRLAARWLTKHGADRQPVKFGCALFGLVQEPPDRPILQDLAAADEFALFAAIALQNGAEEAEEANRLLWEAARRVRGWGRIQIIERIDWDEPEYLDWLVTDGFRNDVMDEYLAFHAATAAGVADRVGAEALNTRWLDGARDIVGAMLWEGPAAGLDHHPQAGALLEGVTRHVAARDGDLRDCVFASELHRWLVDAEADWAARADLGVTGELRGRLSQRVEAIRARPGWRALIEAGLESDSDAQRWLAERAAEGLGLETGDSPDAGDADDA